MPTDDFVVFGRPDLREEDIDEVVETLRSFWIGTGPRTTRLEEQFTAYVDGAHGVAVNSATAALHLGLIALDIGPGDEVIVPSMTFGASANVIVHTGATPVFVDVDPRSRCVSADTVAPALTDRTAAVMPVHMAGFPVDIDPLDELLGERGIPMLADAAHAIETRYKGRAVAQLTPLSAFSFYVTKNMTTAEGGMLVTDDAALAERVRVLSLHGLSADAWNRYSGSTAQHYEVAEPGYKYNLSDVHAALGLHQLERIEDSLKRREDIWGRYDEAFADLPLELPALPAPDLGRSAMHLYSPLLDIDRVPMDRDEFRELLRREGVGTGIHFIGLHMHPYYRDRFNHPPDAFPVTKHISERTFSLPMSPGLDDGQVKHVVTAVRKLLEPHT